MHKPGRAPLLPGSLSFTVLSCMLNAVNSLHFFPPLPSCLGIFCPFSLCCQVVLCCSLLTASVLVLHMVKKRSWQCSITSAKEKDVKPNWIQPWSCFCWDRQGQRPSGVQESGMLGTGLRSGKLLCAQCQPLPPGILHVEVKHWLLEIPWETGWRWGGPLQREQNR